MLPKGSITKVYEHYFTSPTYESEVMRALREFFNRPDLDKGDRLDVGDEKSEGFFKEWFLYDFKTKDGRTILEDFVARNPLRLTASEMSLYRNLLDNKFGIFEIVNIKRDQGLTLRDLQTGIERFVYEKSLTHQAKKGHVIFGRIGNIGDHYELIGADTFSLQDIDYETMRFFVSKKLKITPKEANEVWTPRQFSGEWSPIESKQEIIKKRKEIEQELVDMLREAKSDFGLDDIKEIIYNEDGHDSLTDIIAMFDAGRGATELQNVLELANDAWNYFPHKIIGGLSPVEKLLEYHERRGKGS